MNVTKRQERGLLILGLLITMLVTGWAVSSQPVAAQGTAVESGQVPSVNVPGAPTPAGAGKESTPAVPVTEVPSPAEPDHAKEQLMWALMASYLLQWLKKTAWFPWLTTEVSSRVQAAWGFALAVATAFGVHIAVQGSFHTAEGAAITITGLSLTVFKDVAWQWASQQGWYDLIVKQTKS